VGDTVSEHEDTERQAAGEGGPSEEEMRRQLEEEIRKVRMEDVLVQSVVSILNLAARRIAKEDERDLEQGRLGIDAARALVELLPAERGKQVQQAISELQLLYAKLAADGGGEEDAPAPGAEAEAPPRKPDSGLWTPGS
jgi:hypothetical protein